MKGVESEMRVLFIGDVVGSSGCEALRRHLPSLKKMYGIDMTIVNGENSAEGNGILPGSAEHIFTSGADVITGGNHTFRRFEIMQFLEDNPYILRPANYPSGTIGKGMCIVDKGSFKAAVINLMGLTYLSTLECPFLTADRLIEEAKKEGVKFIFIDMHAEATAEKKALAYYLDGKISALVGTHTHVMTADAQVSPEGTAFITDLGMTGPKNSVLGVKPELAIASLKSKIPVRFINAEGPALINGCVIECDNKTGLSHSIESIEIVDD